MRLRLFFACSVLALFLTPAPADVVVLKSGERLEGKITEETEQELTINFKISAAIGDTRTVPKAEIDKVERLPADEVAFEKLRAYRPGANALPLDSYGQVIAALEGFLKEYPQSVLCHEIEKALETFRQEEQRVQKGELKIGGRWYTKEAAEKERYQLSGQVLLAQIREAGQRGDFIAALNLFTQLETSYSGSSSYPDAVEYVLKLLPNLKISLQRGLQAQKARKIERDRTTQLIPQPQRGLLIAEQKKEQSALDAAYDAASKARQKWAPYQPMSERSLNALLSTTNNELPRLQALPLGKMRESIELALAGQKAFAAGGTTAGASVKNALSLWPQNELAQRLQRELTAAASLPKATPTPTPAPAARPRPAAQVIPTFPAAAALAEPSTQLAAPAPATTPAPTPAIPESIPPAHPVVEPKPHSATWLACAILLFSAAVYGAWRVVKRKIAKPDEIVE